MEGELCRECVTWNLVENHLKRGHRQTIEVGGKVIQFRDEDGTTWTGKQMWTSPVQRIKCYIPAEKLTLLRPDWADQQSRWRQDSKLYLADAFEERCYCVSESQAWECEGVNGGVKLTIIIF